MEWSQRRFLPVAVECEMVIQEDMVTDHGDRSRFTPIANHRDLKLFSRVAEVDMVYEHGQIYGAYVFQTKKSGKELNEKHFNDLERRMFPCSRMGIRSAS